MAFAQYAKASGNEEFKTLAKNTYLNILSRKDNPKGIYKKSTGERNLKNFALPMILSNLVLELENILEPEGVERTIAFSVNEVMEVFLQKDSGLIYENVQQDGSLLDSFDGRLLYPGHAIEAMWFMIDIGVRQKTKILSKEQRKQSSVLWIIAGTPNLEASFILWMYRAIRPNNWNTTKNCGGSIWKRWLLWRKSGNITP